MGTRRLTLAYTARQGDGGLPDLAGLGSVAATADGMHVYVAAVESGVLQHLVRVDGKMRIADSLVTGPVDALALDESARRLYLATSTSTRIATLDATGTLELSEEQLPGASGIAVGGRHLAMASGSTLSLYRRPDGPTPVARGLTPLAQVTHRHLGGARSLAFAPASADIYVAGFEASALSVWSAANDQLEHLASIVEGPGMKNVDAVAVSPDGTRVYAAGFCDHRLAAFRRDLQSGLLERLIVEEPAPPTDGCEGPFFGEDDDALPFLGPSTLTVSQDGERVLVGSLSALVSARLYSGSGPERDVAGIRLRTEVEDQPPWLDYSRFDFASPEEDHAGPPFPVEPKAYRAFAHSAASKDVFWVSSRVPDALAEVDRHGNARFLQKGMHGTANLAGAYNLDISPDGRHVYVAPRASSGIRVGSFELSAESGALRALPFEPIPLTEPGEGAVLNVAATPDGKHVLVIEADYAQLHAFDRDEESGRLSSSMVYPIPDCAGRPSMAVDVVASADGRQVFLADFQWESPGCVHRFRRSEGGRLDLASTLTHPDLTGAEAVVPTADGRHIYAAAHVAGAVARLEIDPATDRLRLVDTLKLPELEGSEFLALAPDESQLFVSSPVMSALVVFDRVSATGELKHRHSFRKRDGLALGEAAGIAVSGDAVYVAARSDDAIMVFSRTAGGTLRPEPAARAASGLRWVNGLVISPDGRWLLAAAVQDNALSVWRRHYGADDGCGGSCAPSP